VLDEISRVRHRLLDRCVLEYCFLDRVEHLDRLVDVGQRLVTGVVALQGVLTFDVLSEDVPVVFSHWSFWSSQRAIVDLVSPSRTDACSQISNLVTLGQASCASLP
jgi:quinol monooxygenase YgiN